MTVRAAGIMFLTDAGEVLMLKRGPGGDWPGAWCFPGGTTEDGETAEQTAVREAEEELGSLPPGVREFWTRRVATDTDADAMGVSVEVDFTTFIQRVETRFDPALNGEHTGFAWVAIAEPPEPLHPGCAVALTRLSMDELGVARAIVAGSLTSPQRYKNMWLFDLRITGTGVAYRTALKEVVYRPPEVYLNAEFLARCNGLAVIWKHPDKSMLNSVEYAERSLGAIMLPYIKGDEVWGIAKIYDEGAAIAMEAKQMSTSPGVMLDPLADNVRITLENGARVLVEDKPMLLDHLAVCDLGIWDKGGPAAGVISKTNGDDTMKPEEMAADAARKDADEKAMADKARYDAVTGGIDKMLSHLNAACDRMDAVAARMDAFEAKDKKFDAKRDGEDEGEPKAKEKPKADAKRDAEGEGEGEVKARELAADKARKDADEKAREDGARRDADMKKIADAVAAMPKSMTDSDYEEMADTQHRADSVFGSLGERAPAPLQSEAPHAYRLRIARALQRHSAAWKNVPLRDLPIAALGIAEAAIYADAQVASRNTDSLPDGQLIAVRRIVESGHHITEWKGRKGSSIFRQFGTPSQRAISFNTSTQARS